ncbi:MAG: flagellar hook-associated protein FlgL [Pelovirga sp.]
MMRATQMTTYRSLQTLLNRSNDQLQNLQLQIASGRKLNRPSDDPTAISPVLSARTRIQSADRYMETIASGLDRINQMDSYLDAIQNNLVRLKEISIAGVNGALSPADMTTYAEEVAQLRQSLLADANASVDGKYLFAGFAETTRPFTENEDGAVVYNGDSGVIEFEIAPNELIAVNLTGANLMQGEVDIFALVGQLEEALRSNDPAAVAALIDPLEQAADQVRILRSKGGNVGRRLDSAAAQMERIKLDMEALRSRYEDVDMLEAITRLQQQEQSFQAALSITGRVAQLSILDYI